jgi:hypothetical protein
MRCCGRSRCRWLEDDMTSSTMNCGLCGYAFSRIERGCGSCPLNAGCDLVKCPSCGYQFPRSSRLINWTLGLAARIRRWFR